MKEFQEIIEKISQFNDGERAVLATVVDVVGSGYRRPGARMLIDENGFGIGTVSGGCLEADVLERAKKVLDSGESTVITYDTTKDENSVFGLSMGCRGIVRILLERIEKESDFFDFLSFCLNERASGNIATLIEPKVDDLKVDDLKVGWRLYENEYKDFPNNSPIKKILEIENLSQNPPTIINSIVGKVFRFLSKQVDYDKELERISTKKVDLKDQLDKQKTTSEYFTTQVRELKIDIQKLNIEISDDLELLEEIGLVEGTLNSDLNNALANL
ncbi:MAG TPA: XdhC family protein, partial [Pyrinomonadaceae bacterium]|nr:XdhC family protein [Pyrinomonadaceae bacterium]